MEQTNHKVSESVVLGTLTLLATTVSPALALATSTAPEAAPEVAASTTTAAASTDVKAPVVNGVFTYDQTTITGNGAIRANFANVDSYLCAADSKAAATQPLDQWTLTVGGDVENAFTASLADLADDDSLTVTMGCTCGTAGADSRAVVNADVTGVTFETLYKMAGVKDDANTVTFTSADGYTVALPLNYVAQRYTLLVYKINGETLDGSVGGTNQLWLGSTSARYFTRDVVSIDFSHEQTPPPAPGMPGAADKYTNSPNAGVLSGGVA